jgi:enoyl-CoA hydratase/carnithine racemase
MSIEHSADSAEVLVTVAESGVATVTLNRPARRNALSPGLVTELRARLAALKADPAVRVVVLTGAGSRASAPGATSPAG